MRGRFHTSLGIFPNSISLEGAREFAKMMVRGDDSLIPAGGNFYLGITHVAPFYEMTLADIEEGEPTIGVNGYARQPVTRDSVGWPTLTEYGAEFGIRSIPVTFTASGVGFDKAVSRLFLTDQETGYDGIVFSLGAPTAAPFTVVPASPFTASYEFFLF